MVDHHPLSPGAGHIRDDGMRWVRDDRFAWPLMLATWLLVLLMVAPDGFDYRSLTTDAAPTSGSAMSRLLWLSLLGFGAVIVIWRAGLSWLLLRWLNPFLIAFVILATASVLWSIEPGITLRRMIRVGAIMLCALAVVLVAWHPRRFQQLLRPIITALLFGSLLFGLAMPHLGIHSESASELVGAWRGLTNHKNSLGALACIGVILWLHAWLAREVRALPALLGGAIAVACLLLSRSSTSLITAVFTATLLLMLLRVPQNLRRYMPFLTFTFVVLLLTYSLAVLRLVPGLDVLLTPITTLTGKDLSFTGRTEIWEIMAEHIALHPWLGSGYGAYWTGPIEGRPSFEFVRLMHFYPGSAHNGYLEIVNDLGFAGLLVLVGYLLVQVAQSLQLLTIDRSQGALYLALFFQQAVTNLSESHWLSVMSLGVVVMALSTTSLARALLDQRLRTCFGEPQPLAPAGRALIGPHQRHLPAAGIGASA